MNNYSEFLNYLNQREKLGIKFGLDNMNSLMEKLDYPNKKLRCIHVAGTNGKGSVCAMLSSVLNKAGIKVGLYTSPHLVDVRERIRINEKDITEEEILAVAKKVTPICLPETTYFELLTAIAIEFFYEQGVEIAITEVGMGGRLDATNVCDGEIAIITDISLEHTQYLGNTVEEIRREKMGIVKPGSILITIEHVIARSPDYIGTTKQSVRDCFACARNDSKTNLIGNHQRRNAALAVRAVDVLKDRGYNIPQKVVKEGLLSVRWPGRFQIISQEPLIILDGAHNPGAAIALRDTVEAYLKKKVVLIIGILKDKNYKSILEILTPIAERVITVTPKSDRAFSGEVLKEIIKDKPVEYMCNLKDALSSSTRDSLPILITGSLYLVGEALQIFRENYIKCSKM